MTGASCVNGDDCSIVMDSEGVEVLRKYMERLLKVENE